MAAPFLARQRPPWAQHHRGCMRVHYRGQRAAAQQRHVCCRPLETLRSTWCASSRKVEHSCKSPVACHAQDSRWLEGTPQRVCACKAHAASSLVTSRVPQQLPQENIKSQMPDLLTGATAAATLRLMDCSNHILPIRTRCIPTKAVWGQRYRGTGTWLPAEPRQGRPGRCKPDFGRVEINIGQFGCHSVGTRCTLGLTKEPAGRQIPCDPPPAGCNLPLLPSCTVGRNMPERLQRVP
jgi:hypothetical protein